MAVRSDAQSSGVVLFARFFDNDKISPHMQVVFVHALEYVLEKYDATLLADDSSYIIAVFNIPVQVPLPAYVAMKCAMEMQQVFNGLQREMAGGGIKLSIGINRGVLDLLDVYGTTTQTAEFIAQQGVSGEIAVSGGIYEEIKALGDQF